MSVLLEETKEIDGTTYILGHTKDYVKIAVPYPDAHLRLETGEFLAVIPIRVLTDDTLLGKPNDNKLLNFKSK